MAAFLALKVVSFQLPEWSHTAVFKQYNHCCLLKSSRGDKISPAFSSSHRDVVRVPRKEHPLVSNPHTRLKNLFADPLSCLKNLSTEWMLNRAVFRQIVAIYGLPDMDLSSSTLNHQVKSCVSWIEDPKAWAIDAFSVNWGGGEGRSINACIPSFQLDPEMSAKGDKRQRSSSARGSSMANIVGPSDRSAMSTAS